MGINDIVSCAIHPGIGIVRIRNSPEGYFIEPEAPDLIYGLDADGAVVAERSSLLYVRRG